MARSCLVPLLLAATLVAGCGNDGARPATQVAAKVNADELTVHELNLFLAASPDADADAKRALLDQLIDRQLARQQAIARKLDRSPAVMQAIEVAKSDVLARAYLEQIAAAQPRPSAEEIHRYYAEHPELFAQRRLFELEEIVVLPQEGLAERLREYAGRVRSGSAVAAWLRSERAQFTESRSVRAAEHVPLDLLPRLQAMKPGETLFVEGGGRLNVFTLVSATAAPLDEASAAPHIAQLLSNQRLAQAIQREMAQLKGASRIEYLGEFAAATGGSSPRAAATDEAAPPPRPDFGKAVRGLR